MAADEVLLESAVAGTGSLRFYGWTEATLSLGYFQPHRIRGSDERLAKLPFIRRPTGGEALVHHHELTYALGLPASLVKQGHQSWLGRMHTIIAQALSGLGVSTATVAEEKSAAGLLCFQHLTPGDLVVNAAKVVGSAQRKQRGALLQHGAILLATSPHAPALPGIRELTGSKLTPGEVIPILERELAAHTPLGDREAGRDPEWAPARGAGADRTGAARAAGEAWRGPAYACGAGGIHSG